MAPLTALAAIVWMVLLVAAPILPGLAGGVIYGVGSVICHQIPERSFHVAGFQLPVCARCLGLYAGAALGAFAWLSFACAGRPLRLAGTSRGSRRVTFVAAVPTALTLVLEWAGVLDPGNLTRALAGALLGAAGGLVVVNMLATLHYGECAPPRPTAPNPPPPST